MNAQESKSYALAVGARLRQVRRERGLSLMGIEQKTDGHFKAVVIGSYERADRAVTVSRLAELAEFYGLTPAELLPPAEQVPVDPAAEALRLARRMVTLLQGEVPPAWVGQGFMIPKISVDLGRYRDGAS